VRNLRTLDEQIADSIRASEQSGELQRTRNWGKPLDFGDGFDETPAELRMAFKILKDGGFAPPEVELLSQLADLRAELAALDPHSDRAAELQRALSDLQLRITVRMERLSSHGL
jgi:hypothetical protein